MDSQRKKHAGHKINMSRKLRSQNGNTLIKLLGFSYSKSGNRFKTGNREM
jgi:hypothetical protein